MHCWSVCVVLGFELLWRRQKIQPPLVGFPLAAIESKYRMQVKNKETRNKLKQTPNQTNKKKPHPTKTRPNLSLTIGLYRGVESPSDFKANKKPDFLRHQENELPKGTLCVIMENKNNLVHSVKATLVCITLPGCCKPIFTSQLIEGLC